MRHDRAAAASTPPLPSPEQRLAASREKLRAALAPRNSHDADDGPSTGGSFGPLRQLLSTLPISRMAMRGISRWWRLHPWRSSVEFVFDATDELVRPAAEKHPWMLLAGALVVGAVISRARPWRLLSGGALLASVIPQLRWSSVIDWVTTLLRDLPANDDNTEPPAAAATTGTAAAPMHDPSTATKPASHSH